VTDFLANQESFPPKPRKLPGIFKFGAALKHRKIEQFFKEIIKLWDFGILADKAPGYGLEDRRSAGAFHTAVTDFSLPHFILTKRVAHLVLI
jgi:hypothetical protein